MEFKQIYTKGLAHCSYVIGGRNQCVVVDPARDVAPYIEAAKAFKLPIAAIIETHLHADFVSGHIELAERTGATIYVTAQAKAEYHHYSVADGEEFLIDTLLFRMLDTPGHTPESAVFIVSDLERGKDPILAFTGDTLLVGDAGRPDLFPDQKEELAGKLYDSLRRIETIGDHVEVYPAHGAGSLCGRSLSSKLSSTIGTERMQNEALNLHPKETFIRTFLKGMPEAPDHFSRCSRINRIGAPPVSSLKAPAAYAPKAFLDLVRSGHLVVDSRSQLPFAAAHVPGSFGLSLKGNFATFSGWVLPPDAPLLLIADSPAQLQESLRGLYSVGLDNVAGYLEGGMEAFEESGYRTSRLESISIEELKERMDSGELLVVDTRLKSEYDKAHISGTIHAAAPDVRFRYQEWEGNRTVAFICNTGNRSLLAGSLMLRQSSMERVINVIGGTTAWAKMAYPLEKEN